MKRIRQIAVLGFIAALGFGVVSCFNPAGPGTGGGTGGGTKGRDTTIHKRQPPPFDTGLHHRRNTPIDTVKNPPPPPQDTVKNPPPPPTDTLPPPPPPPPPPGPTGGLDSNVVDSAAHH